MSYHLVVTRKFGTYKPGETITDPDAIAKITASKSRHSVVRINAPVSAPASVIAKPK